MVGNTQAERLALEATYEDTVTIKRTANMPQGNIDRIVYEAVCMDQPCAFSRPGDSSNQTNVQQDLKYNAVLFIAPEIEIRPGDTLEIARYKQVYNPTVVGRPAIYATHQQVYLYEETIA